MRLRAFRSIVYGTRDRFADTGMIADYEKLLRDNGVPFRLESFGGRPPDGSRDSHAPR